MSVTVAALIVLVVACAGLGVLTWHRSRQGLIAERLRREVVVTLKSGESFMGVLFNADRECLVLRKASLLDERSQRVALDGEVLILRGDVAFMQAV